MQLSSDHKSKRGLRRALLPVLNLTLALIVTGFLVDISAQGLSFIPALGPALNSSNGVWSAAHDTSPASTETLHFPTLQKPVTIILEKNGVPHIQASTDADLFWAIGYVQARYRLTQMELMRRQGEGRMAEILGGSALAQDKFEDSLGLQRTAQADWNALPSSGPARPALIAYAQGVNASIQQDEQNNTLPLLFKLLNYKPAPWTPVDTFVVQEDMDLTLDFTSTPLDYALYVKTLGYERTMSLFPVLPQDTQHPYDMGPYQGTAITPLPEQLSQVNSNAASTAIADLKSQIALLPQNILQHSSSSNNWAVNGPLTASGSALMAGDPHLDLTLPAIWFQLDATSPGYAFSGASIPGLPAVFVGKNQHISWSMTDTQNQATLFYLERTDVAHADQYYWNGAWRKMQHVEYTIPVKGAPASHLDVSLTVHGPIVDSPRLPGQTIAVDWMGAQVSTEIEGIFSLLKSSTFAQFRSSLRAWVAPTLNFVYADDQGNIGMIAPGYYPIVKSGAPWLPLPGTGEADVVGTIPFDAVPQVYDPPDHMVFSANQRPVSNNYPYYIGTTLDFFSNGYRADEIYTQLSQGSHLTLHDMENLQTSTRDYLASLIVPKLLSTLSAQTSLSPSEQAGESLLANWDDDMQANAAAPTIWWNFWQQYITDTFLPWWQAKHVPYTQFTSLTVSSSLSPLDEDLETWTLHDPTNAGFTLPSGQVRSSVQVMLKAYQETIASLAKSTGEQQPQQWLWGQEHSSQVKSLLQVPVLGYAPFPANGDDWTVNATYGMHSSNGPSYRMLIDWGSQQSETVYPGGQDENPLSPWYQNEVASWRNGQYYPQLSLDQAEKSAERVVWHLQPA